MKKTVVSLIAVALSCAAFADAGDSIIRFYTKAGIEYADGTPVKVGERFALVWVPAGSSGVSVNAKGELVGGEIVKIDKTDTEGECHPNMNFSITKEMSEKYKNGTWSVLLLDTRSWSETGIELADVEELEDGNFRFVNVNASGVANSGVKPPASGATAKAKATASSISASTETAVPEGTPQPEITDIKYDGDKVYITVKNTVPYIQYALSTGNGPDKLLEKVDSPRGGADAEEKEITLVAPAKDVSAFFKVVRR